MGGALTSACYKTIKDGENYNVTNQSGHIRVVHGPTVVPFCTHTFAKIDAVVAAENEYIEIKHTDGHTEFQVGPASVLPHPVNHQLVTAKPMTSIHRGAVLLVYRKQSVKPGAGIESIILEGPCTYMPKTASEWTKQAEIKTAGDNEYLRVKKIDGGIEFKKGPTSVIVDPEKYNSIEVLSAIQIGDQELIVVYRQGNTHDVAVRHLVCGPRMYIPESSMEWTHQFSWTGEATEGRELKSLTVKKCDALKFTKLRTCPGKMYVDVDSVRTSDNALLIVKLMIFFRYESVDKMLDNTNDPFGEIINASSADIIEWVVSKKFEDFLASTERLNTLDAYPQLQNVVSKIGLAVEKVVFRGYEGSNALQRMHDAAIEQRTELAFAREAEEEKQKVADFTLARGAERVARQNQLEVEKVNHELAMKAKNLEAELKTQRAQLEVELERLREIKNIDDKAEIGKYLIAKDGHAQVLQCGTLLSGADVETTSTHGRNGVH